MVSVNHFFPEDAVLLRSMYQACAEKSQKTGWRHLPESIIEVRALAILTIPVAATHCVTYAARGILNGCVEILNGNLCCAFTVLKNDIYATMQCVALVIAGIAYATLGLLFGSLVFSRFIPDPAKPTPEEAILALKTQLIKLQSESDELKETLKKFAQGKEEILLKLSDSEAHKKLKDSVIKQYSTRYFEVRENYTELQREFAQKKFELEVQLAFKLAEIELKNRKIKDLIEGIGGDKDDDIADFCIIKDDPEPKTLSWYDAVTTWGSMLFDIATYFPKLTTREILRTIRKAFKKTSSALIDKKDPWKAQRYIKSSATLAKAFGHEAIHALKQLDVEAQKNPLAKEIAQHIHSALDALTKPGLNAKASLQFDAFQIALCQALAGLKKGNHGLDEKITSELNRLCHDFFTKIDFLSFYTKLVYYVATNRNKNLAAKIGLDGTLPSPMALSEKMQLIFEALPKSGSDFTAPSVHVLAAKMGVLFSAYDPLHDSNIPTTLVRKVHTATDGIKPPLESVHFRTGVPIGPKTDAEKKPWDIADVTFVPEYEALLDHLKANNEKLLVILHLDPKHYDEVANGGYSPKAKEAVWVRMFMALAESEKYKGVIEVALLPLDGKWLTEELAQGIDLKGKSIRKVDDFIEWLVDLTTREKSPFFLPASVGNKQEFVRKIAEAVRERYFPKSNGTPFILEAKEQRQAYFAFFQAMLAEALQLQTGAKRVQRNCKDAVDRTMSLVGTEMLHEGTVLNQSEDAQFQDNLVGSVFGASLANVKRRIIDHDRFEIFMSSLKHLEWLKNKGIPLGPVPEFNGYKLSELKFPTDSAMSLYAEPMQMATEADYLNLLKFEESNPITLPTPLPKPVVKGESENFEQIYGSLKQRYENSKLNYQLQAVDKIETKTIGCQSIHRGSYCIQQNAKPVAHLRATLRVSNDQPETTSQFFYEVDVKS